MSALFGRRAGSVLCTVVAALFASACAAPATHEGPKPSAAASSAPKTPASAPLPSASVASVASSAANAASSAASPAASTGEVDAGLPDASADAALVEAPIDWKNKVDHIDVSPDLEARARGLFAAIVADDPALGEAFWFPKEPFIPLKDVKGPDKYWNTLHKLYENDVHALHRKRKSWDGATFESFAIGSSPTWVKPGDEVNKIGYYRSYHGKLRYLVDGERYTIDVHTVITWQGRWFITHLSKKKK